MKKAGLFFGFWLVFLVFVLANSKPSSEQLAVLDAAQPALDSVTDILRYDSLGLARPGSGPLGGVRLLDSSSYWIAVRFSSDDLPFTLQAVFFQIDNSLINVAEGCSIYVAEDSAGRPGAIITDTAVSAPLPNKLRSVALKDSIRFSRIEKFWIILGPVPGGPDNDDIGDGWWGLRDTTASRGNSFVSFDGRGTWDSLTAGNWVLRAGGEKGRGVNVVINELMFRPDPLSADFERNHQWVELYNPGPEQDSSLVRFVLSNRRMDSVRVLRRFIFPANSYLVIHFYDSLSGDDITLADGRGDVFLGKRVFFKERSDVCALFSDTSSLVSPSLDTANILDVVPWDGTNLSEGFIYPSGRADTLAVQAGIQYSHTGDFMRRVTNEQVATGPLLFATPGTPVGRDSLSSDTSEFIGRRLAWLDFQFNGGAHAFGPTMGRRNVNPFMQCSLAVSDPTVQAPKAWTVMLYVAADDGGPNFFPPPELQRAEGKEAFYYDLLNQLERSLSGITDVNLVLFFDGSEVYVPGAPNPGAPIRGKLRFDASPALVDLRISPLSGTDVSTGDSATLLGFLSWAMATFPASRYALAIKGDGMGWQGCLSDLDDGQQASYNWLELADLKRGLANGLNGTKLDLLIFDAPLMGQLEVAAQVDSFAHQMVASPEKIEPAEVGYPSLVRKLQNNPGILSRDLATFVVDSAISPRTAPHPFAAWSAVDLDSLDTLLTVVHGLANDLRSGVEELCARENSADNFQLKMRNALQTTDHYGQQSGGMADYMDLKNFASELASEVPSGCGSSYLGKTAAVGQLLTEGGPVIAAALTGARHGGSGGVSIYFPSSRDRNPSLFPKQKLYSPSGDFSYEQPGIQLLITLLGEPFLYAADTSACYPHTPAGTCLQNPGDSAALEHPFPPARELEFVDRYGWDEFLLRYYKPVADAGLDIGVTVNQPVVFNATGSSDPDDPPSSLRFFWDLRATSDTISGCALPQEEDLDKNCQDDNDDERDLEGVQDTFPSGYSAAADYVVTLHVWDGHSAAEPDSARHYQTDRSTLTVRVSQGIGFLVEEDIFSTVLPPNFYEDRLEAAGYDINKIPPKQTCPDRQGISAGNIAPNQEDPIFWETGRETNCLFPPQARTALETRLNEAATPRGVWVFSPKLGVDTAYQNLFGPLAPFFQTHFNLNRASSATQVSTQLHPAVSLDSLPFLQDLAAFFPLQLNTTPSATALETLSVVTTTGNRFPLLRNESGKVVAVAVLQNFGNGKKRGRIFSSFGLEHIRLQTAADSTALDTLLNRLGSWLTNPAPRTIGRAKGDMDDNNLVDATDVVLMLNCVFLGEGDCDPSFADMNCDTLVDASDMVELLNLVFLGVPATC